MRLSIIIVNWNTREFLQKCLQSLFIWEPLNDAEVIVVDNASSDGSVEMVRQNFTDVRVLSNIQNKGFAQACNQGIENSLGEYVLLLNSDCELQNELCKAILSEMEKEGTIGIAGPVLQYPNGIVQSAGERFVTVRKLFADQILFRSSPAVSKKVPKVDMRRKYAKVDYISGACMFIRRAMLDEIGLFREDFFMYAEDVDLCFRAQKAGYKCIIIPEYSINHHKSRSTNKNLAQILGMSMTNNCIFIKERFGSLHALAALKIYAIGVFFRIILSFFRRNTSPIEWMKAFVKIPVIGYRVFS